jgi:tetratricopeptide (TPR) repeat protein
MRIERIAVLLVVVAGCKGKPAARSEPSPAGAGGVVPAAPRVAGDAGKAAPVAAWELRSAPIELACGADPEVKGTYQDALAAGRAAGAAKRWALAVSAFERALASKPDDAVALDELSLALLRVGDPAAALTTGERAIAAATTPNARASAHYNAGRAAEALGDVDRAKAHFEQSIELRPNDTVRARLAKLGPVAPRRLEKAPAMTACQALASVEAVCACLAKLPGLWGDGADSAGPGTCEPLAHRGAAAALVSVISNPTDPDARRPGTAIVLVAKRGATWSALGELDLAPEIDTDVSPRGSNAVDVVMYDERPIPGGTPGVGPEPEQVLGDRGRRERGHRRCLAIRLRATCRSEPRGVV